MGVTPGCLTRAGAGSGLINRGEEGGLSGYADNGEGGDEEA